VLEIVKYSNRKLYDKQVGRYITLTDMVNIVRAGIEFRVVDHKTRLDVTNEVLSNAINKQCY
jgi:polyhydroxyalkanoate synthesis regulator protein